MREAEEGGNRGGAMPPAAQGLSLRPPRNADGEGGNRGDAEAAEERERQGVRRLPQMRADGGEGRGGRVWREVGRWAGPVEVPPLRSGRHKGEAGMGTADGLSLRPPGNADEGGAGAARGKGGARG